MADADYTIKIMTAEESRKSWDELLQKIASGEAKVLAIHEYDPTKDFIHIPPGARIIPKAVDNG